jgi:hypothetical protein
MIIVSSAAKARFVPTIVPLVIRTVNLAGTLASQALESWFTRPRLESRDAIQCL